MSPCDLKRCCPECPRTSSPSGMTRHRLACKIYQQHLEATIRLARYAEQHYSRRMNTLQAKQRVVDVEEADSGRIQTDIAVSFSFSAAPVSTLTHIVLTCHSHLTLIRQTSTCLMQSPVMIPTWHARTSQTHQTTLIPENRTQMNSK
jgi:hypothetical protein